MSGTEFDQLLAGDEANISIDRRVVDDFSLEILEALNDAASIFRTFAKRPLSLGGADEKIGAQRRSFHG